LSWQLPDGCGPYEIPPASDNVNGNTGPALLKLNWLSIKTSGFPLITRFETEHCFGVIRILLAREPLPESLIVPSTVPETEMAPPPGQGSLTLTEMLQVVPVDVTVQPGKLSG
jgi:hypothetical protein